MQPAANKNIGRYLPEGVSSWLRKLVCSLSFRPVVEDGTLFYINLPPNSKRKQI